MSEALGRQLAVLQLELAQDWNKHGPEYVEQRVRALPITELVALVMVNVGQEAHDIKDLRIRIGMDPNTPRQP